MADFVYWSEVFIFNFAIYLLSLIPQFILMYGAGYSYDYFAFIGIGYFLTVLILGGLFSTVFAMLVNAIF